MTTGNHALTFFSHPCPDIGPITACTGAGGSAVVDLGPDVGKLFLGSADIARQLLRAAFEALQILDPGTVVTIQLAAADDDEPLTACARCGVSGVPLVPLAFEPGLVCWAGDECDKRQAAKARECGLCGASERDEAIGNDGECLNSGACGRRQQAKQAAKAGAR